MQLYKYLSWIVDAGICVLFLIWGFWIVRFQTLEQFLTLPLVLFSILAVSFPIIMAPVFAYVLDMVHVSDPTKVSYLGFSITIAATGYLFWSYFCENYRSFRPERIGRTIFILFGPALLFFFTNKWWFEMGQWWLWVLGDDWTGYQIMARKIIVSEEWLTGGVTCPIKLYHSLS